MNQLISIIIPAYNVEDYLPRCLDSILLQSYSDFEILIIDDGSTDKTPKICDEYARQDGRIRVIHKENAGVASARNAGLEMFAGDYVMFVDADDWIYRDALQILHDRIVADHSDLAIGRHVEVISDGVISNNPGKWMQNAVVTSMRFFEMMGENKRCPSALWGKLYKREIIQNIRVPDLLCGEDTWVYPHIIANSQRISIVNNLVYFYFIRENSITHTVNQAVWEDMVSSHLYVTSFLLQSGYTLSAKKQFDIALSNALKLQNKRSGRVLFLRFFTQNEIAILLKGQSVKTKIKWLAMYLPFIYNVVCFFKKRKGVE